MQGSLISQRMVMLAVVAIVLFWWVSRGVLPTAPTADGGLAGEVIAILYINGAVDCPTSPEFGLVVADEINIWAEPDTIEKNGGIVTWCTD